MANIITGIRIAGALSMIFCPAFSKWFYIFYLIGGASDVLDGIAARRLGKETEFGAHFDTIADIVYTAVVIVKVVRKIDIPVWMMIWIVCIAAIRCVNIISGFVIHRRFVSEHTVMNRICGVLLFAIPLCVKRFPRQPFTGLMILTCAAAAFAAVQEGYYILDGKEIM